MKKSKIIPPLDIESEFIESPTAYRKKKEKTSDLTKYIKAFLEHPIERHAILVILLRLLGNHSEHTVKHSYINIYAIHDGSYIIKITKMKSIPHIFYLGWHSFHHLSYMKIEELDSSILRQRLAHAIREWLHSNGSVVTVLP